MTGKFSEVIRKAKEEKAHQATPESPSLLTDTTGEPVNQLTGIPVNTTSGLPDRVNEGQEEFANLSIRVPKRLRQHWAAEAKRAGTTLTKEISSSLERRFGKP